MATFRVIASPAIGHMSLSQRVPYGRLFSPPGSSGKLLTAITNSRDEPARPARRDSEPASRAGWRLGTRGREVLTLAAVWILATALGVALPHYSSTVAIVENSISDLRMYTLTPTAPLHPDIVVLGINEDTLADFPYRTPVDRAFMNDILTTLAKVGVRAVGVDLLFDQPSEPEKDAALLETLRRYPVPLVTGWVPAEQMTERQLAFQNEYLAGIRHGYSNLVRDAHDGVVRDIFPGRAEGSGWTHGFAGAIALALGKPAPRSIIALRYRLTEGDEPAKAFAVYPIESVPVLAMKTPDWLRGKIVLIGADLPQDDRHATPFVTALGPTKGNLPGVTIHAHGLAQLLDGMIVPRPTMTAIVVLAGVAAAAGVAVALWQLGTLATTALGVAGLALLAGGTTLAFVWSGVEFPLVGPSLAFAASLALSAAAVARSQGEQRRFIREAFGRYVSPAVVHQLVEDPSKLKLGGERRHVSYVFTDIAGFTSLSEKSDPELLVNILNEYLDGMTRVVMENGGMVDKFIGDAVVGLFGAPLDQPDHAARAIRCAIGMDRFTRAFEQKCAQRGVKLGITRCGVNSGEVVVGNFGGEKRLEYTSIGDTVNTASRLEGVNKYLGTRICIAEAAARQAPDIAMRPIARLVLKGKTEPIATYEPRLGVMGDADTTGRADYDAYLKAYALLAKGDSGARAAFEALAVTAPADPLVRLHLGRLQQGETGDKIVMTDK